VFASKVANYVSRFTLYFVRTRLFAFLLPWLLTHMTFALPVNRLHETPTLLAFHHPKPSYPLHILLVPKRDLKSLTELRSADSDFLNELFQTVKMLVERFNLEEHGYRLIANGGRYQEIPHLHFHLISSLEQED
jgi:histidine triad (HIT) family protein